jgi:cytochrome oxidase Cu insertion factor (SCO1/SenC/PrrC family)
MANENKQNSDPEGRLFILFVVGLSLLAAIGGWLVVATSGLRPKPAGFAPDHPRTLVSFVLTNQTGRTVTEAELTGKYLVVDFLLTSCSLTCPVVNRHVAEIQQLTTNQPDVRLVSLTVDPRDDTVAVLADYAKKYGADPARWLMLTGDQTNLYHLIATSFLNQDLNDPFSYMPGNFSHTDRLALVDPQGQIRYYFDGLSDDVASNVVTALARLRKNP